MPADDIKLKKMGLNVFYTAGDETSKDFLLSILSGKTAELTKNGFKGKIFMLTDKKKCVKIYGECAEKKEA
jgi:hypothetical protein